MKKWVILPVFGIFLMVVLLRGVYSQIDVTFYNINNAGLSSQENILYIESSPKILFLNNLTLNFSDDFGNYYKPANLNGNFMFDEKDNHFYTSDDGLILKYEGKTYNAFYEGSYNIENDTYHNNRTVHLTGDIYFINFENDTLEEITLNGDLTIRLIYLSEISPKTYYFKLDSQQSKSFGKIVIKTLTILNTTNNNSNPDYDRRISSLESNQSQQTYELSALEKWKQDKENEINSIKNNLTTKNDRISSFNTNLTAQTLKISSIETNISSLNQRISTLESWKIVINSTISAIQTTISNMLLTITGHTTEIDNMDTEIANLENQTANLTFPNYFKYLSSSERRTMVCGLAQDNHLTSINDLGYNCTITYKTNQYTKKVTSTCKCTGR